MLPPDDRTVAVELLRPPSGYRLDIAILTTFSLDLEALLALPLAVLAHADGGVDELLHDPLLVLEALREAGDRIHVFVDPRGIAIPRATRALYALLESSVHPVRAPNHGSFHPKVWVARFAAKEQPPLLRVAVLSRNLTFDRSWDVALSSEGSPNQKRRVVASRPLGALIRALPRLTHHPLTTTIAASISTLAEEAERTLFPAPDGFDDPVSFHSLGLQTGQRRPWTPQSGGSRVLAVAPFVNRRALDAVAAMAADEHILISRQHELDALPNQALDDWDRVFVLSESAADEPDDETGARPSGLHAKLIAIERGWDVTWYVGSANLSAAAFTGLNVEMMASVTGRKGRRSGQSGQGIDRFFEAGFMRLCEPYRRVEQPAEDLERTRARALLEQARDIFATAALTIVCAPEGSQWAWTLDGTLELPAPVEAFAWPVTLPEDHSRAFEMPLRWTVPSSRLTTFVAVRLGVPLAGIDDIRFTIKVPAEGMPPERIAQVLRGLIDSPERLLRFLRALLGGLDGIADWAQGDASGRRGHRWGQGFGGETLLDDLVRAASRDPSRLEPVRRLLYDLRGTEEGRAIVPDELLAVWTAVDEALGTEVAS